jgi:hypothetical protein
MSGRSTPLAGYPEQYRMEGRMGWLAAFGTAGYPDGNSPRVLILVLTDRTTTFGRTRSQFWTYKEQGSGYQGDEFIDG